MVGVREGPVEIITAVAALVAGVLGPTLAYLSARRAKGAQQEVQQVRRDLDTGNDKSAGRVLAEAHQLAEHNAAKLDTATLEAEVRDTHALVRELARGRPVAPPELPSDQPGP